MGSSCTPADTTPFATRFGDDTWQVASSIAIDPNGHPVIAGAASGPLDLGFTTLSLPTLEPKNATPFLTPPLDLEGRFFVARLAPAGCAPFAVAFDGSYTPFGSIDVTLAGDGAVVLTAGYHGVVDFGGGATGPSDGVTAGAVVKLTTAGEHVYSHVFHADQLALARPAVDAQGNVYVAGKFAGELTFDDASIATATHIDAFVAKLDPAGAPLWSKHLHLGAAWTYTTTSVVAWPEGDVAVAGQFAQLDGDSEIDLGAGPMWAGSSSQSGFVTSFDAAGEHRWQSLVEPLIVDATLAPSGALVVAGVWNGAQFPVQRFDTTGATSEPVLLESPEGTVSLAVGANDEALLAGALLPPLAGPFAIALDASGEVLWNRTFDAMSEGGNYRVAGAFGPAKTPWLAGGFMGTMDFGTGAITAEGKWPDVFVAALQP
jgi:hypothetical protein